MKKLATFFIRVYILACVIFTYWYIYDRGVEDGYWEHESEENIYGCQVIDT